ncbi:MAG: hemolysin secretion protein [Caulobacteraceae bacterium]|nr:hemolysin secretion protein [Caulobacteraceae bacterium]
MTTADGAEAAAQPPERPPADRPPSDRPAPALTPRRRGPPRLVRWGLFLLLPVVLIILAIWYVTGGQITSIDDAYIDADKVGVSTDVSGTVKAVDVTDNQSVASGQVLFRLDEQPFRLALERAEGQAGTIKDDIDAQRANYRDLAAQIVQARVDVAYYATEYARQHDLLLTHVASQATADTALRNLQTARQKLASLQQQQAAIAANLNGEPAGPVERNPRYRQAMAERGEAARQLDHTVVRAAFPGIATNVTATAPGRYLPASGTAFYLVSADHVWVTANPKETELTYVRVGQPARVTVDAYPGTVWHGVVESISPAAAQEFSLLPAQNSSGNWVKVVQRIPMRVRVDTRDRSLPPLRAGMSVEVRVDTGHRRGLPRFLTGLSGSPVRGSR